MANHIALFIATPGREKSLSCYCDTEVELNRIVARMVADPMNAGNKYLAMELTKVGHMLVRDIPVSV